MSYLSIDPSITCTGYSIIDNDENLLSYGYIISPKQLNNYNKVPYVVSLLLKEFYINHCNNIIIEGYAFGSRKFGGNNHNLIEFVGTLKYLLYSSTDIEPIAIPPKQARKLVVGNGNADKNMVYEYIKKKYKLEFNEKTKAQITRNMNITDAILIGLAYARKNNK